MTDDDESPQPRYGRGTPFQPTDKDRKLVGELAAVGAPHTTIAAQIGISHDTLKRHFPDELEHGLALANAKVAGQLYNKAIAGDTIAQIFWLKTRGGWVETKAPVAIIGGGPDDPPIAVEEKAAIRRLLPPPLPAIE